ncbi:unnamed protein product [Adineta steineri]|uniref:Uncharacterized protein n=1 Tax=Adineta steineri TaxID=433720 RepID=A0A814DZ76_9BILA|nr:unnamed protein product [Adineta steineri]
MASSNNDIQLVEHSVLQTTFSVDANEHSNLQSQPVPSDRMNRLKWIATAPTSVNGHFAFHDYFFYFANNDNKNCVGQLRYKFYLTGTNPFDPTNIPNYFGPTAGIVCQLVGAGHYTWPTEK